MNSEANIRKTQNESEGLSYTHFNTTWWAPKTHKLHCSEQKRRLKAEKKAKEKAEKLASQPPPPSKAKSDTAKAKPEDEEEIGDLVNIPTTAWL